MPGPGRIAPATPVRFVSVVRDFAMYARCLGNNPALKGCTLVPVDNTRLNEPIPVCYNRFLDSPEGRKDGWIVFCHEDFEPSSDLPLLCAGLDASSLHGVVGAARRGFAGFGMQRLYGNMIESRRDGTGGEWTPGRAIARPVEVECFDCCCLMVHSSLVAKHRLRFDPNLQFDLYVEDFCASAKLHHGIRSFVHPVRCRHRSGSRAGDRLFRLLPYLEQKYPRNCFTGTLVYFGAPPWQKRLQDSILRLLRRR